MHLIYQIFGAGKDLTILQMACRTVVVFIIALILIRISGRRSFGLHTPLDNVITIVLGAVLSRAIVGASDFLPVMGASTLLVLAHRIFAKLMVHFPAFARLIEGEKMLLYKDGSFIDHNLNRAQVCKEDIMQEVRKTVSTDNLEKVDRIYIERNGEVNSIKK